MFKKLVVTASLILGIVGLNLAQTTKNSKLIGGTGTVHIGTGNNKGTLVMLSPRVGQFIADDLVLGATLPLSLYAYRGTTTTSIGLSPFVRGYFGASATRFLLEGRIGYQRYAYNSDNDDFNDSANSFTYGIGLGAAHFISDQIGLEFLLSYDESGNTDSILTIANLTGINFNVGFQIYLPSGK